MLLVIKSLISGLVKEIEINSLSDIVRLASDYPVIDEMRRKTSNPLQLLQYLVKYLSKNHLSAWIEGDSLKSTQLQKAEQLLKAIKGDHQEEPYVKMLRKIGNLTVWIVDGKYIRDNIDVEFTNFAQHYRFPKFIPKNELWIGKEVKQHDQSFYVTHLLEEFKQMDSGKDYDTALKIADRKEKASRKKAAPPQDKEYKNDPKKLQTKLLKTLPNGVKVFLIRGNKVRELFDIDFTEGGHDLVYKYIPSNTIWLDDDLQPEDRDLILLHEMTERHKMQGGWSYDKAHQYASSVEWKERQVEDKLQKSAIPKWGTNVPNQGMVTQVQPQKGELVVEGRQPYKKRFPEAGLLSVKDAKHIKTEKVSEGLWHHYGPLDENHTIHVLSSSPDKFNLATIKPRAGIITGKKDGKNYIRAAFSETSHDDHLDALKSKIMSNPKLKFEEPIAIDSAQHMEKGWEHHNPDLVHGIIPDKSLQAPPNTFSKWISFAGVQGDETPRVVTKEAESRFDDPTGQKKTGTKALSYFDHPTFNTAHREAAYSKLADEVFHLGEYVPKVAVFRHPISGKAWSAMQFIPGLKPVTSETIHQDTAHMKENGDIYKMAIMNMIMGNNDRHFNNLLKDPSGHMFMVDHGLAFDYNHITTDLMPVYIDDPHGSYSLLDHDVPESVHQWLWGLDTVDLANKLHKMGAPQDVVMTAVRRLADARSWSNMIKHGSHLYNKEIDQSLRHLVRTLRSRQFSVSDYQHKQVVDDIKKMMMIGRGDKTVIEHNVPITVKDSQVATLPEKPAKVDINATATANVRHPAEEVTLRHPGDQEGTSSKRRNR